MALNKGFFDTLPKLESVAKAKADVAWLVYDLVLNAKTNSYELTRLKTVYTASNESLEKITRAEPGDVHTFIEHLQEKVTDKLENPPDTEQIDAVF